MGNSNSNRLASESMVLTSIKYYMTLSILIFSLNAVMPIQ